jgi:hypothetical protein
VVAWWAAFCRVAGHHAGWCLIGAPVDAWYVTCLFSPGLLEAFVYFASFLIVVHIPLRVSLDLSAVIIF